MSHGSTTEHRETEITEVYYSQVLEEAPGMYGDQGRGQLERDRTGQKWLY